MFLHSIIYVVHLRHIWIFYAWYQYKAKSLSVWVNKHLSEF